MALSKRFWRSSGIVVAFALGFMLPIFHSFAFLIRYLIMVMLFLVFLQLKPSRNAIKFSHLVLFVTNMALGPMAYFVAKWCGADDNLALAALFTALTPTATAAPVIMGFLEGNVEFVVGGFLITNLGSGLLLPYILPSFIGGDTLGLTSDIFNSLLLIIGLPLVVAIILRAIYANSTKWPAKLGNFSFSLWLTTLFLIASNTAFFIFSNNIRWEVVWYLVVSAIVCGANFGLGYLLVPHKLRREGSQTLGQKNTTLTIFLAMTYVNPLVALGPTCYVLWHNLWNAYQMSVHKKNPS